MIPNAVLHWRGAVILSRDLSIAGERSEFFTRVRSGEFVAILRGIYVRREVWAAASTDEQYLLRIVGASALAPNEVFSHDSAAALWRLPAVSQWSRRAHVVHDRADRRESSSVFVRHRVGVPAEVARIDGLAVTELARTVVDIAATWRFGAAVAVADAALRRLDHPIPGLPFCAVTRDDLVAEVATLDRRHGSARATRVVGFADGAADRPGESLSRVAMSLGRVSPPQLQVVLYGASGKRYVVDFWWPEFGMIGEFDGVAKYSDPVFLRGRTPEQALLDEKYREDDLRANGYGMTRWSWVVATDPARLRAHLHAAGVR